MSKAKAHNKIYGKACFCLTFLFDKSQNQRAPCCLICGPCILRRPFFQTLKHESSSGWAEAIHFWPGEGAIVNTTYSQNVSKIPKNVLAKDETIRTPLLRPLVIGSYISRNIRFAMPIETICIIHKCNMHSIHIHIWSESDLVNFWIPNIPKADLRSS